MLDLAGVMLVASGCVPLVASLDILFSGSEGIGANRGTESIPAGRLKMEPLKAWWLPPRLVTVLEESF